MDTQENQKTYIDFEKAYTEVDNLNCTVTFQHYDKSLVKNVNYKKMSDDYFVIKDIIGKGGMGTIYLAQQNFPKREVAIKRSSKQDEESKHALFHEGMLMGALEHPNIIPIYGIHIKGENSPEVIMKKVQGVTLNQIMKENTDRKFVLKKALDAMICICHALEYAHSKNIIHRDVKLQNIMLDEFGAVYLLDWGIALSKDQEHVEDNIIVGTPSYMAPEMLFGKNDLITEQTDVFLVGASLHKIITGKTRYWGHTFSQCTLQIQECLPYHYTEVNTFEIGEIINKACSKNPNDRFASIKELRLELEIFLEQRQVIMITEAAKAELEELKSLKKLTCTLDIKLTIHEVFQRALFGFQQALNISSTYNEARLGMNETLLEMIGFKIKDSEFDAAEVLIKRLRNLTSVQNIHLEEQKKLLQLHQKESDRIKHLGQQYDVKTSRKQRRDLILFVFFISILILLMLPSLSNIDPKYLSPKVLFHHSIFYLTSIVCFLMYHRSNILKNPNTRRFFLSILGIGLILFLHRWIGWKNNLPSNAIVVTDYFILALGFINMTPNIRGGITISLFCIMLGIINHLYPFTIWYGTIVFTIFVPTVLILDWWFENRVALVHK